MLDPNMVPSIDPNPLPAPFWVFKTLLLVTFFLHIVAMNFMLGGALMAVAAWFKQRGNSYGSRLFFDLAKKIPVLLAATISLGIAPLLFLQVLYGQYFYTSSILLAWPWFLVIVLLIAAYYGFYFVSYRGQRKPRAAGRVMLFSTTLVLIIGFIYTNNITLGLAPSRWAEKYFSGGATGWNLNLSEPTLIPRYLHFMVSAVAMGGLLLVLMAWAKWKQDEPYARQIFHFGGKAFQYATMAQFVVGFWFLFSLPRPLRTIFLGDNPLATILLSFGLAGTIASILLMSEALRHQNIRLAAFGVTSLTGLIVLSMTGMRDILRDGYLKPYFHPEQMAVKTQVSPMFLFLGLFVVGIALWFAMLWRYGLFRRASAPEQ
jgi:hypothetical protein